MAHCGRGRRGRGRENMNIDLGVENHPRMERRDDPPQNQHYREKLREYGGRLRLRQRWSKVYNLL